MATLTVSAFQVARVPKAAARLNVNVASSSRVFAAGSVRPSGVSRRSVCVSAVLTADAALDVAKMAPLGDRLLVKPKAKEETTAGGILLASSSAPRMDEATVGTVMAVGDEVEGIAVGDMVLFTKYGTSDIEVPDGDVCFVAQKSILAKLS